MRKSSSVDEIVAALEQLAALENLAGAVIHLNDTYLIDERRPEVPGMARVAGLVRVIRETVRRLTGEDRTLVVHSGDYLSPSAMSREFKGAQMVDLLNCVGVDVATIGNHEFDFGREVLRQRLSEFRCRHVLTNMAPPPEFAMERLVLWPPRDPFVAIVGIAGEQTIGKAAGAGFSMADDTDHERLIGRVVDEVRRHPAVGALIVLSHMDRNEDKALQALLSRMWGKDGFVYVMGGHDHDIGWREDDRLNATLLKCRSNAKSITVTLLPKDGIAAPPVAVRLGLRRAASKDMETLVKEELAHMDQGGPPRVFESNADLVAQVLADYRSTAGEVRPDFRLAMETTIRRVFDRRPLRQIHEDAGWNLLTVRVLEEASLEAALGFRASTWQISGDHLFELPIDAAADARIAHWQQQMATTRSPNEPVFQLALDPNGPALDARDHSLRWHSTDFGNFAADAIRHATGADIALLNSGAFRIDGYVSPELTTSLLRDVFIFDAPGSIATAVLPVDLVLRMYDHALSKGGHGAFLQVSESREAVARRQGQVTVALIAHMLRDREDGFLQLLMASTGQTAPERALAIVGFTPCVESMVTLIGRGGSAATVQQDRRLSADRTFSDMDRAEVELAALVDAYCAVAETACLTLTESLILIRGINDPDASAARVHQDELKVAADALIAWVLGQMGNNPTSGPLLNNFYIFVKDSRLGFERGVPYHRYLEAALDAIGNT